MLYLLFPVCGSVRGKNNVGVIGVVYKRRCYYAASLTRCFARDDSQPAIERAVPGAIPVSSECSCQFEPCNTQPIDRYFDYAFSWQEIIVPGSRVPQPSRNST